MIYKKIKNKIKKRFNKALQGLTLKDKVVLALVLPLGRLFNINDWRINIQIKNTEGLFRCQTIRHFKGYSTDREAILKPYFKLEEGLTFIDVGSNIGRYSIMIGNKKQRNTILAIEPDKSLFKIFKENLELNNIRDVHIVQKLIYSKRGKKKLYINTYNRSQNTMYKNEILGQDKYLRKKTRVEDFEMKEISVETTTLDLISKRFPRVGLIKLDIQGAELEALKGANRILSIDRPNIIFEAWNHEFLIKIKAFLAYYNYSIDKVDETNYFAYYNENE